MLPRGACQTLRRLAAACLLLLAGTAAALPQQPPRLQAIVAVADPSQTVPAGTHPTGIDATRVPLLDEPAARARLAALLGAPVTPATMDSIRQAIIARFRAAGRPFLDVGFPPQDITEGVLRVVVREFRVGEVRVAGNDWFGADLIRRRAGLRPGETIDKHALDARLDALNAGPFLKVQPEFTPGAAPATTDVVLRAHDRLPLQVSASVDNSGSPTTGWQRWTLGGTWGNGFWNAHTLSYQFTSSADFWQHRPVEAGHEIAPAVAGHSGSWQIPLPWDGTLVLSGSYMRQVPRLGPDLGSVGLTTQAGLQYLVGLGVLALGELAARQDVAIGYDFKRSNNDLSFGGIAVQRGFSDVSQFWLRYGIDVPDRYGRTSLQTQIVVSPGGMTPDNTTAAFEPQGLTQSGTPGASARYLYDRIALTRLVPLPAGFGVVLRATGQFADHTLLPSEQLAIAGVESVRGYQEGGVTGSSGLVVSAELRGPSFSPGQALLRRETGDSAQFHVFYDRGQGWNRTPSSAAPANLRTASVGFGARYELGAHVSARIDQGWQLVRQSGQGAHGAFAAFSVAVTW